MGLTALEVRSPHSAEVKNESSGVKNEWSGISSTPLNLHDMDRNNLTFTIFYSV